MGRFPNPDIKAAYDEFIDNDSPAKCAKVRCLHCGYTRAKNTTRQIEHLNSCQAYLNSAEAQSNLVSQIQAGPQLQQTELNGSKPNPNLQVHRRGPNGKRRSDFGTNPTASASPVTMRAARPTGPPQMQPSLVGHLLSINRSLFDQATQQPFLSHAGCGTLAGPALSQWMSQDSIKSRGYIQFVGALIAKLKLPNAHNSQFHPMYRTLDLLISAVNNMRREMGFFENTAMKYSIPTLDEPPAPPTRAYVDFFTSVGSPSSSLLEGMVILWATGHCCRSAWRYASSFTSTVQGPPVDSHIAALHQSLIPNWTSAAFSKFVDACGALVDELANNSTNPNGKDEMMKCDQVFRQICWLEEKFWPRVDGMGEEAAPESGAGLSQAADVSSNGNQTTDGPNSYGGVLNGVAEAAAAGAEGDVD